LLVFSVGLTLEPAELGMAMRRPHLVALPVLLPWLTLLPAGVAVARFLPGPGSAGLLTIASAPTEVSAVLLTAIAAGDVALTTTATSLSLLISPLAMALAFQRAGLPLAVQVGDLVQELALGIAAPLIAALVVQALARGRARRFLKRYGSDFGTVALMRLLFGAGATARTAVSTNQLGFADYLIGGAGILVALALPFGLGAGAAALLRLPPGRRSTVVFTTGMREFGVATAVAQVAVPAAWRFRLLMASCIGREPWRPGRGVILHALAPDDPGAFAPPH
jgi:BASS family bile acid:Na+ symporter